MLTVMCPNCRHRFPPGVCCSTPSPSHPLASCLYGGILVPRTHPPASDPLTDPLTSPSRPRNHASPKYLDERLAEVPRNSENCQITTSCDLTGGSVTITTPNIQSGGCLIQGSDPGVLVQGRNVLEVLPRFSGGSCFVQESQLGLETRFEDGDGSSGHRMILLPPSGCQELPGSRQSVSKVNQQEDFKRNLDNRPILSSVHVTSLPVLQLDHQKTHQIENTSLESTNCRCKGVQSPRNSVSAEETEKLAEQGLQIQVNATLQLPARIGQCTVNITASTSPSASTNTATNTIRPINNFNGGGLVQENDSSDVRREDEEENDYERREGSPTTPVSWLMPCPWGFDTYLMDRDLARLAEVKRSLQSCGWYHEGISWQQSEALLKNASVGRWLMRDSSDSRYTFAVSVQTSRGPTSVRVHHFLGRFRLDAEPRLAFAMPLFECPIKMLEYYVEYSKTVDEHRKEVWVDYSGQIYSEIYLTKPLLKEIRPLSHLARLVVNKNNLRTEHLPLIIRNFLAEYPYTL